jgi:hypothetical protein
MFALITVLVVLFLYFIPTISAYQVHHKNKDAIFATNLFFGWTFIGWMIALIWALKKD